MEQWLTIAEFPEYEVSDLGQVKRVVPDRQGKMRKTPLKSFICNSGYVCVRLYKDGGSATRLVHRLLCIAFNGAPPTAKHHAAHRDGNRTNNTRDNLRWRTPSENNMERHAHGTMLKGENHPSRYMPESVLRGSKHGNAKLTESDVSRIRSDPRNAHVVALEYHVCFSSICKIRKRVLWKHVP